MGGSLLLTSLGVARQPATRVGSGKKVFYQGTSMVAVPFSKGRETVADIVNGPTYKRAPFKIEHNQPTLAKSHPLGDGLAEGTPALCGLQF